LATVAVLLALPAFGGELFPESFTCTGEVSAGLCWLSDIRLYAMATWRFTGVSGGNWILVLEGVADDPCADCEVGRDLYVRVYYSEGTPPWQLRDVLLRNVDLMAGPNGYRVRAELSLRLGGPELWVMAKRVVLCDPRVGFTWTSAYLVAPAVEVPSPPALPLPPPPPTPPPPACPVGPAFSCLPGELVPECLPPGLDLRGVERAPLPETYGPGDATVLELGHYAGRLGEGDYQDWYRVEVPLDEARLIYVDSGDLVVDVCLVHDPCGTDLAVCLGVQGVTVLSAPCYRGLRCVKLPNGEEECFLGDACRLFIRIVCRSGTGEYKLSLLTATPDLSSR
jgi:hypothetical protein